MTNFTGSILYNADRPDQGDADEADLNVSASGQLLLSLQVNNGAVTGNISGTSISTSGSTNDDLTEIMTHFQTPDQAVGRSQGQLITFLLNFR
jgi:hypothetical protein